MNHHDSLYVSGRMWNRRFKRRVVYSVIVFFAAMLALALYGQAVGDASEDTCGDNHRPVAVIEVRSA